MKKLSDYEGEAAIELWADMLEPMNDILADPRTAEVVKSGKSRLIIAKTIFKNHPEEAKRILLTIDPTPLNGLNIILRLVAVLADLGQNEEIKGFFGYAEQVQTEDESGGLPTENTEDGEK